MCRGGARHHADAKKPPPQPQPTPRRVAPRRRRNAATPPCSQRRRRRNQRERCESPTNPTHRCLTTTGRAPGQRRRPGGGACPWPWRAHGHALAKEPPRCTPARGGGRHPGAQGAAKTGAYPHPQSGEATAQSARRCPCSQPRERRAEEDKTGGRGGGITGPGPLRRRPRPTHDGAHRHTRPRKRNRAPDARAR